MKRLLQKSELSENLVGSFVEKIKNAEIKKITKKISSAVSEILSISEIDKIVTLIAALIFTLSPSIVLAEDSQDELMANIISSINISAIEGSRYTETNNDPLMQNEMQKDNPNRPSSLELAIMINDKFGPRFLRRPIKKIQGTIDKLKLKFSLQKKIEQNPELETKNPSKDKEPDKEEDATFMNTISKIISIQIEDKISKKYGYDTSFSYDSSDNSLKAKATFDVISEGVVYNTQIVLEKDDYSLIFRMPFDSTDIEKILH